MEGAGLSKETDSLNGSTDGDFIDTYLEYTKGFPTPRIYRLWSAIATIAGALGRRVWSDASGGAIYPNQFILLVGPPGTGKTMAINTTEELWRSHRDLRLAPNDMTKASLIDSLSMAHGKFISPDNSFIEYHSMLIAADEFGVLVPTYDIGFLAVVSRIYDNPVSHIERRRHSAEQELEILCPQLNIVCGVQPDMLSAILPEEAWGQGFTSRFIMIYSDEIIKVPLFSQNAKAKFNANFKWFSRKVAKFASRFGKFYWHPAAAQKLEQWYMDDCPPQPDHVRLVHYNRRRHFHVTKLAMISAASARDEPTVELSDVDRAIGWLLESETLMPNIFKAMGAHGDWQLLSELYYFVWSSYQSTKRPVAKAKLQKFLSARVPVEKINRLLDMAESSNVLTLVVGKENSYAPNEKPERLT